MPTDSSADRKKETVEASLTLENNKTETPAMSKTLDVIVEAIRNPRHPFRKLEHQPKKARKHRYERRKVKEFLHLTDLQAEEAV